MSERTAGQPPGRTPSPGRLAGQGPLPPVDQLCRWIDQRVAPLEPVEVPLEEVRRGWLAEDVVSRVDVPCYTRAMMDGYALRAADTRGASAQQPAVLTVIGQSLPAQPFAQPLAAGQAVKITTGAPVPPGADAVVPAEQVLRAGKHSTDEHSTDEHSTDEDSTDEDRAGERVRVQRPVAVGKHVGRPGEDIRAGDRILPAGQRLRPQDLGVLSAIGMKRVLLVRPPRVRILVTGNELLPPGSMPQPDRIVDANSPMLAALIRRDGGVPRNPGIVADDPAAIADALLDPTVDAVVVAGGSSVGEHDYPPRIVAERGTLAWHGVSLRPGRPTGVGVLKGRLVFLLPGNPVACLCAYDFFAGRAIRQLAGGLADWPHRRLTLPLESELRSVAGRVDYARVQLVGGAVKPLAIGGASLLSSATRADGFVIVPHDVPAYPAGASVDVLLY